MIRRFTSAPKPALDLVAQTLGIGNRSAIVAHDKALGLHPSGCGIDFDLRDEGSVSVVALIDDAGDAAA